MDISVEVPDGLGCNEFTINGSDWSDTWIVVHENKTSGDIVGPGKRENLLTYGAFLTVWSGVLGLAVIILLLKSIGTPIKRFTSGLFLVSQFLLGLVVVSLTVLTEYKRSWQFGKTLCHVWLTFQIFIIALSSWTLLMTTIGYFILLKWQNLYKGKNSSAVAAGLTVFSLLFAVGSAVFPGLMLYEPEAILTEVCASTMTKEYALSVSLAAFIIPACLTVILTISMLAYQIWDKNRSKEQINEKCKKMLANLGKVNYKQCPTENSNTSFQIVQMRNNSSSGNTICAVVNMIYISLWTPFHAANLLVTSCEGFCLHPSLWSLFIWLGYSSCGIMPIVFIFSKELRSTLKINICKATSN